jgi:hypothetical protein
VLADRQAGEPYHSVIEQAMQPPKRTIPFAKHVTLPTDRPTATPPRNAGSRELLAAAASVVWFAGWLQAIYDEVYESLHGPDRSVVPKPRSLTEAEKKRLEENQYD